jgi:hypothetical protein
LCSVSIAADATEPAERQGEDLAQVPPVAITTNHEDRGSEPRSLLTILTRPSPEIRPGSYPLVEDAAGHQVVDGVGVERAAQLIGHIIVKEVEAVETTLETVVEVVAAVVVTDPHDVVIITLVRQGGEGGSRLAATTAATERNNTMRLITQPP